MNRASKKYFLISILFLMASLCLWSYFLFFVHSLAVSAETLEAESAQAYEKKSGIVATEALAGNIATDTDELTQAFASSATIANVVDAIETEGSARSVAVKVQSINSASSTNPALLTLDMDIVATGSWANLVAFSGSVERMPYALSLTKASFFQTSGTSGGWSLSAHITSFLSP